MKFDELVKEGGWANPITQGTKITPELVEVVVKILEDFVHELNRHLANKKLPPVELGNPAGSTTYYKRDLEQNPTREYGDIDVNLFIPQLPNLTNNANDSLYKNEIKEFCDSSRDYQTQNGNNVIFSIGKNHVQVDLITSFIHNKDWSRALSPEYNVKGVLCNSIYSAFGEAMNLSFGAHGIQIKTQGDKIVPFRTIKDVVLTTITKDPENWAIDIAKYFGCKRFSDRLKGYPGRKSEMRVKDMIESIKGIAETLEMNGKGDMREILANTKAIYLAKIDKAANSSKFDKAATPEAIKKAEDTKTLLATKSADIARNFDNA